jgi:hypothetical protein
MVRNSLRALVVATVSALAFGAGVASAATDPYTSGTSGYDVSYPQCGRAYPPGGAFWVVGVDGGKPFSPNPCLASEYAAAPKSSVPPSVYMNTGYSPKYSTEIAGDCSLRSASIQGNKTEQQAWAIDCSESEYTLSYFASQLRGAAVSVWWLDVETANSWSSKTLNQYAIRGIVDKLTATSSAIPVGIYSNQTFWSRITGGNWNPAGAVADWATSGGTCGTGFSGVSTWLLQGSSGGFDSDAAC